jgi:hypothetical protein
MGIQPLLICRSWSRHLFSALTAGLVGIGMNANADDHLDPNRSVRATFTLSVNNARDLVHVSATFQADGLQLLASGGRVTVNDIELMPERLQKQGFWYQVHVKRAPVYVLQYSLAGSQPVRTHELPDRKFLPEIPATVSRSKGFVVPFVGPPIGSDERLFMELRGGEGPSRWSAVLRGTLDGARILVPASALAQARLGRAEIYVGVMRRTSAPVHRLNITHGSGTQQVVDVTD